MQGPDSEISTSESQYVTARVHGQLLGLAINVVDEVFLVGKTTPVPLAPPEVAGVLNLRGRVVTTVDTRRLLDFPPADEPGRMAVGIEWRNEAFGLIIDEVGDVLTLDAVEKEGPPPNLDRRWLEVVSGVHRLPSELLLVFDVMRAISRIGSANAN